jgi:hypothetical protein
MIDFDDAIEELEGFYTTTEFETKLIHDVIDLLYDQKLKIRELEKAQRAVDVQSKN